MTKDVQVPVPELGAITEALHRHNNGDPQGFVDTVKLAYKRIHGIAKWGMEQKFDQPLRSLTESPTCIANDAIMRLQVQHAKWKNSGHFFAITTRLVLRCAADYRRERNAAKRGRGHRGIHDDQILANIVDQEDEVIQMLLDALDALDELHPLAGEVLSLHQFADMPLPEIDNLLTNDLAAANSNAKSQLAFAKLFIREHFAKNRGTSHDARTIAPG